LFMEPGEVAAKIVTDANRQTLRDVSESRTPLASLYSRTITDEYGDETVQYLEPLPNGQWRGWEVYSYNGTKSDSQTFAMSVLPIGYTRCDG